VRRPRRVQRRNIEYESHVLDHSVCPLYAGGDISARCLYLNWVFPKRIGSGTVEAYNSYSFAILPFTVVENTCLGMCR
jgi:hypothetical protein